MSKTYCDEDGYVELGADLPHRFWYCERCRAQNSDLDGECQYCEPNEPIAQVQS